MYENNPSGFSCIIGDTLVTLADGKEIPLTELNGDDKIRAWDFVNGKSTSAPLTGFFKGSNEGCDMTEGKFIAINSDGQEYVGYAFAKVNRIFVDGKATETLESQCSGYLNYLPGDFITGNDGHLAICNMFDQEVNL